jgi:hypothetical protein
VRKPAAVLPIYDPARLAAALAEQQLPGRRSKTAIIRLRRERGRRRDADLQVPDCPPAGYQAPGTVRPGLAARASRRLTDACLAEIERRGGETSIEAASRTELLAITDRSGGLVLLHATGWRYYGGRADSHRRASLSYLCGADDAGRWAARVPGTITAVREALAWITPADVQRAELAGRRVRRQGDIYAIETTPAADTPSGWVGDDRRYDERAGAWVTSHYWNAETRRLIHRPEDGRRHRPLQVSYPARFAQQVAYGMGRGAGRRSGD